MQGLQRRLVAALGAHQRGELASAERMYREILNEHPRCFDALHLLGVAAADRGALDEGIALMREALAIDAFQANAYCSLARALLAKADAPAALACLDRAVGLPSATAETWYLRANVLLEGGRLEEAVAGYEAALRLQPAFPEAWNNLAAALRALKRNPRALECVERALLQKPAYAFALNNQGLILLDEGRAKAAVDSFRRAIAINPRFAEALHNLGTALSLMRRFGEARDAFAQLSGMAPQFPHVQGNLLYAELCACDWRRFEAARTAVTCAVQEGRQAALPVSFLAVSDSAALQMRCAQIYARAHFPGAPAPHRPPIRRRGGGRIRLAYLSGDFGDHPVSHLLAGVLETHDPAAFETIAFSWGRREDGVIRQRLTAAFSRFEEVGALGDAEVLRRMRDLGVDIAVDLTGPTFGQRTGIFAQRGAPVQALFLGYAGTSGAPYMDYLIADPVVIPPGEERWYSECVVRLPDCCLPNDDRRVIAPRPSRSQAGLPEEGVVFCAFTNAYKINPAMFDVWMKLLQGVPGSVLWLRGTGEAGRENLLREAAARGVPAERLVFAPHMQDMAEHLARESLADLFLDTFPYNAHSTACDALWCGVPVLTLAGQSMASRTAASALAAVGLAELIAESPRSYERKALELGRDRQALDGLKRRLEQARSSAPLFDTARFTRHLEAAYREMHARAVRGEPPAPFSVARLP